MSSVSNAPSASVLAAAAALHAAPLEQLDERLLEAAVAVGRRARRGVASPVRGAVAKKQLVRSGDTGKDHSLHRARKTFKKNK